MLKITFLGTGTSQGIPVIGSQHPVCLSDDPKDKRLRVSVLLQWEGHSFVIDCGPDFRQQMIRCKLDQLDGILFTHEHADHTAGLDDIRPFFFRQGDIPIYLSERVHQNLAYRFNYIFSEHNKYPGAPSVNVNIIDTENPFELGKKKITPIAIQHNKLPVMGFRVDNFAYLTDVKTLVEKEFEKLQNLDHLVLSALRIEPHKNHLNLEEALGLIDKIKPRKAYLTHISHLMGFHEEVTKELPSNVFLAYDNLTIKSN